VSDWPRLERAQTLLQLRAGAKSLGLHVGGTLIGTAPIFALTAVGGPALVPLYAVPNRIFSVASGALLSFNALMQPAFGQAWAKRDLPWLRDTARVLLRQTLALAVGIGAGLIALGPSFVSAWTAGRLSVSAIMVTGIALAGGMQALVGVMKYMLSGMNRHRTAAASELISGVAAMAFCWALTRFVSADFVAFGVFAAALLTSLVLMPRELARYLEAPVTPRAATLLWTVLLGTTVMALGAGAQLGLQRLQAPPAVSLVVAALCSGAAFFVILQLGGLVDVLAPLRRIRGRSG
jgi:O-antigen/teichoic acid export membrane protein